MDNVVDDPFDSEEMTRIYREAADGAESADNRLTVLLAPYGAFGIPLPRGRDDAF